VREVGSRRGLAVIAHSELHEQVKKNEIGGAYSMYEGQEKCIKVFGGKNPVEPDTYWGADKS